MTKYVPIPARSQRIVVSNQSSNQHKQRDVSDNFLPVCSFRINRIESPIVPWTGDCGESLTLYDAARPDDARIIKTFCDTFSRPMEKHDFVSTGNAMFVRFESKTGSYSG